MDGKEGMLVGKEGWEGGEKGHLVRSVMKQPLQWLDRSESEIRIEGKCKEEVTFLFN